MTAVDLSSRERSMLTPDRDTLAAEPLTEAPATFMLPRFVAERLQEAHLRVLRAIDADERVGHMLGERRTQADTATVLAQELAHWSRHGFGLWVLRDPLSGEPIGRAGLQHVAVEGADEIALAVALLPRCWGHGIGTEAARALVTIGRDWVGLRSVVALVPHANRAARCVAVKAAMVLEREVEHAGRRCLLYRTD
jgi:RimJ/RimL family protein N-acetyltransferase